MNIALIGCGRISSKHFDVIKELKNELNLIAVCDIMEERAKSAAKNFNCKYYTDYTKMLENEKIDIISICSPSGLHVKHAIEAAERNIDIILEKPMALKLEDADKLINKCDENNVKLFVIKQNRLNPGVSLLKKAVEKNRFGKIFLVNSSVYWHRAQDYYSQAKWRGTWEFDGGAIMNQGSHYIDLMLWLLGPVDYVMAITGTLARKIETEDTGSCIMKFRNGAIGNFQITVLTYPKNYEGSITIIGEKGTAKIGGVAINKIEKWEFEKYDDDDAIIEKMNCTPINVYGNGHIEYYKKVIESIKGGAEPMTDGRSGRKSLELILGIYESAKTGSKVSIPLNYPRPS